MAWSEFVDGGDGFSYGIPYNARRVVKFNPLDKSMTEIGPDLGDGGAKWMCGVLANTGIIYCAPFHADHILKIDTIQGTVETLISVFIGLLLVPIVYSSLTPRRNNCHLSWGVTLVKENGNGGVEL